MELSDHFIWTALGLIVGISLVSGPLVASVDFTGHASNTFCEPSGDAQVTISDFSTNGFIMQRSGANASHYEVVGPPVQATVGNIRGCPVLTLELQIPELGFRSVRKSFLAPGDGPSITLTVVGGQFDEERITQDSYPGVIKLSLTGDETRTLYNKTTTINVSE